VAKIDDFLGKNSRPDRLKQFEKLSAGKTKEEIRILEMELLEPEPIQQHIGEERRYVVNSEHSVKMVFKSKEEMDFFGRFIPIAEFKEKSITDIKIILDLFLAIDSGTVSYDKKTGNFVFLPDGDLGLPEPKSEKKVEGTEIETKSVTPIRKFFRR
jgi:hypothetical protein